jgi:hypothetical protein
MKWQDRDRDSFVNIVINIRLSVILPRAEWHRQQRVENQRHMTSWLSISERLLWSPWRGELTSGDPKKIRPISQV